MKRRKAFISSTRIDLGPHRAHVIATLRKSGFDVDPMEEWTAATDEPKRFSRKRIEGCDLVVLLVARRRGHVPRGERRSITQMEVDEAQRLAIPRLVFMLADDAAWPAEFDQLATDPLLQRWRADLAETKGVGWFGADPASIELAPALARWVAESSVAERDQARAELAQRATQEVVAFLLAVQYAERGAQTQANYDAAYQRWELAAPAIAAELRALGADAALLAGWQRLADAVLGLYRLSGTWSEPWRSRLIEELKATFFAEATDWSLLDDPWARRRSNDAFQAFFGAWWKLRDIVIAGCAEFGRRLRSA